ncbi:hypothetical protein RRG08_064277 [Elysia crispata]|uniref:Uncharacterized protein n=1 Tax=Elysia crispata TaxID=231223 RepID=A0AAE0YSC4_9GAST|nr:hypothetical protein RRG08_064277 [Elysia crispata]
MCGEPIAERTSHPQTLNVEDILYDDNFRGMKDHFLMWSATWDEVATWFEKLFPKKILSRGRVKALRSGV